MVGRVDLRWRDDQQRKVLLLNRRTAVALATLVVAGVALSASGLSGSSGRSNSMMSSRFLAWTQKSTPRNMAASISRISLWFEADDHGRLTALVTHVERDGRVVQRSAWPVAAGTKSLALVRGQGCELTEPPTQTTLAAVVTDSVGPIPVDSDQAHFHHVRGSLWNSDQGPLRVELDQPADLSSRRLTHRLQPGGEVVATISDIRYETQAFPWDELTEIRRLCGGPPAPSDGSYGGLTGQPA